VTYREKPFKLGVAIFKANPTKIHTLYTTGSIVLKTGKLQLLKTVQGIYKNPLKLKCK